LNLASAHLQIFSYFIFIPGKEIDHQFVTNEEEPKNRSIVYSVKFSALER